MTAPPSPDAAALIARDDGLLWHPYAPLHGTAPYAVTAADGVHLTLTGQDGRSHRAIDAMSSWWSAVHGYRHPELDAAITDQVARFSHVMFGGLTHEPAVTLAEQLIALTPESLGHVFLADSGSVAVEVALKLAVQYQQAHGRATRSRFVALRGGYHGDTAGAMSVCDPVDGMHSAFAGHVAPQLFLPRPPQARLVNGILVSDADALARWTATAEALVATHAADLAGIIIEPVLQGAGGMFVFAPEALRVLRRLADQHDIVLIADEVATAWGRTGRLFASDWADIVPDVLCVGKALTGGYLSLAAMICSTHIAEVISHGPHRALLHGPTFMANPLACAVAHASLTLIGNTWQPSVQRIQGALAESLADAHQLNAVRDVRVLGAVGVVELHQPVDVAAVTRCALDAGVWLRPFRSLVYTMPPYVCSAADAAQIGRAMVSAVAEVHG